MIIDFLLFLTASNNSFFCIDDYYEITHKLILCVSWFVLSTCNISCLCSNTSKWFSGCINNVPFASLFVFFNENSFHDIPYYKIKVYLRFQNLHLN